MGVSVQIAPLDFDSLSDVKPGAELTPKTLYFILKTGAGDGDRTRDFNLGKVGL
jgi:hypothetical protein